MPRGMDGDGRRGESPVAAAYNARMRAVITLRLPALACAALMGAGRPPQAGSPVRAPDFTVMLGGIRGGVRQADGFVIDRPRIPAARSRALEFRGVHVVVGDIGMERSKGDTLVLQGVLGMNLLLPSVSGLGRGDITDVAAAPFKRVWIDGPRHTLSLDLP